MLGYSIVHNGEISSYGINRRYLESFGYACPMQTDSEVVAYLLDLLIRRHGLNVDEAITALAPPYQKIYTPRAGKPCMVILESHYQAKEGTQDQARKSIII